MGGKAFLPRGPHRGGKCFINDGLKESGIIRQKSATIFIDRVTRKEKRALSASVYQKKVRGTHARITDKNENSISVEGQEKKVGTEKKKRNSTDDSR